MGNPPVELRIVHQRFLRNESAHAVRNDRHRTVTVEWWNDQLRPEQFGEDWQIRICGPDANQVRQQRRGIAKREDVPIADLGTEQVGESCPCIVAASDETVEEYDRPIECGFVAQRQQRARLLRHAPLPEPAPNEFCIFLARSTAAEGYWGAAQKRYVHALFSVPAVDPLSYDAIWAVGSNAIRSTEMVQIHIHRVWWSAPTRSFECDAGS